MSMPETLQFSTCTKHLSLCKRPQLSAELSPKSFNTEMAKIIPRQNANELGYQLYI